MAKVIVCDICGEIVKGNTEPEDWTRTWDEGQVTISLAGDMDRCDECIRKTNAKLAYRAWEDEKATRNMKPKAPTLVAA